ncbi:MAG: DUF6273 domain-containing protein [Christensenellaceae bacterium]|nr:DUF6273 domain-containing protein [Christensenellaceae bacterium]
MQHGSPKGSRDYIGVCLERALCPAALVRSPNATNSYYVRYVNTSGAELNDDAYNGNNGLRPALVDTATE